MAIEITIAAGTVTTTYAFILNFLLPSLREELGLLTGFKSEQKKLRSLSTRIQRVLEDAMRRQLSDSSLQDWLEKLMDVAYHADDVLDKFNFEELRRKTASQEGCLREVRDFFSGNNQLRFRFLMAHKIKNLREKIDSFAEEVSKFNLGPVAAPKPTRNLDERVTHSFVTSSDVFGRDEDQERVVKKVLSRAGSISVNISVVAIVGVGGVGKTTLAQLVYNDSRVGAHFDLKIWICVSDNFDLRRLLISIIKSATEKNCEADELDQLQRKVRAELYGKKYLLVLDNVWNEEQAKWTELEELIRCGARGSKVLVTTRSLKVASIMGSSHVLPLSPLPDDICWDLFVRRAFEIQETPSENLIAIGKEIVKKCRGIPLAAQALGSLLRFKRDVADWRLVEESEMWQLFKSETDEIMPVLRYSYDHLSPEAKLCFAFCSLFPKGYELEKETLILQWTCNRFVLNERGHGGGHEVFNDLLWRYFFLETKKDDDGQVRKYKLHDLMHDLALSVAGKHFCMLTKDISGDTVNERTHHLLINQWSSNFPTIQEKAKYLRTLLAPRCNPIERSSLKGIFVKLRCLRVLDLSSSEMKVIPDSVGSLIHLRYLDLSSSSIEMLPKSIGYLLNLQVLKLRGTKLRELPKGLKKLDSLRHLDIRSCSILTDMPVGVERLTNLQTLTDFTVGTKKTSCALQELKDIKLSGELFIWHLENFKTESAETQQTILLNKENLVSLQLEWHHRYNSGSNDDIERALHVLRPHENLKRLQLHNYSGLKFPPWLSESSLPRLVEIRLVYCTKCEHLPAFGNIASLKDLQIIGMHKVKQISREFYGAGSAEGFPSLEKFALFDMEELQEWPVFEGNSFPKLKALTIGKCPALKSIPLAPSLQTLEISHCSSLLLASLPSSLNLPALSSLVIDSIKEWTSLPDGSLLRLNSLKKLLVSSCQQLEYLPLNDMQQLVMLQSLQIIDCPELNSLCFNASRMTCLRSLNIHSCRNLMSLPNNWTSITSLQSMSIIECRSMASWAEPELKGLSSLSDFTLEICNNNVDLSGMISHISNLETLTIHGEHDNLNPKPSKLITGNSLVVCCCGDRLGPLLHGLSNASSLENLILKNISDTALPDSIGEIQSLRYLSIYNCAQLASLPNNLIGLTRLKVTTQGCPMLET